MNTISAQELDRWHKEVWADGIASRSEADALFEMDAEVGDENGDWPDFFAGAISEFLVSRGDPRGYVTDDDAKWLADRLSRANGSGSTRRLRLLEHLFERADFVPLSLKAVALDSIEQSAIAGGEGATDGLTECDVARIRRFLFAPAGDGVPYVTRPEAEMLWRLKDRFLCCDNSPQWLALWVHALANHLLSSPSDPVAERRRALDQEAFLATPPSGLADFLDRMATSRPDFARAVAAARDVEAGHYGRRPSDENVDELDQEERQWTEGKVIEDGEIDDFEQALLEFVVR